jgi:hypothetical protein
VADTYINPFGLQQDPSKFEQTQGNMSLYPSFYGAQNQERSRPFVDMARQGQALGLQKQGIETQEFGSDAAKKSRMSKFALDAADNDRKLGLQPFQTAAEREGYLADALTKVPDAKAKVAQADQLRRQVEGTPYKDLVESLSASVPQMSKASESERQLMHAGIVRNWEQRNQGLQVPQHLRVMSPDMWSEVNALHLSALNTPEHRRALQLEREKEGEATNRAMLAANAQVTSASIAADAHIGGINIQAESQENTDKAIARINREISDKKSKAGQALSDQDITAKKSELANHMRTKYRKDIMLHDMTAARMRGQQYDQDAEEEKFLRKQGLSTEPQVPDNYNDFLKQYPAYKGVDKNTVKKAYKQRYGKDLKD